MGWRSEYLCFLLASATLFGAAPAAAQTVAPTREELTRITQPPPVPKPTLNVVGDADDMRRADGYGLQPHTTITAGIGFISDGRFFLYMMGGNSEVFDFRFYPEPVGPGTGVIDVDLAFSLMRLISTGHELPEPLRAYARTVWKRPSVTEFVEHERPPNAPDS